MSLTGDCQCNYCKPASMFIQVDTIRSQNQYSSTLVVHSVLVYYVTKSVVCCMPLLTAISRQVCSVIVCTGATLRRHSRQAVADCAQQCTHWRGLGQGDRLAG